MGNISMIEPLESRQLLSASAVTSSGLTLSEVADQSFSAKLGKFSDQSTDQTFNIMIDWGDGSTSAGKAVAFATGKYFVKGIHTYAKAGKYDVDVKVYPVIPHSLIVLTDPLTEFHSVINAATPTPSTDGESLTATTASATNFKLGEFTQKVVDLVLSPLIDWGDGTHSHGKLVGSYATGEYYVKAQHTYAKAGTYKVNVKVYTHPVGSNFQPDSPIAKFNSVVEVSDG